MILPDRVLGSIDPAFLGLVDVHIQQVLRQWNKDQEGFEFTNLPVLKIYNEERQLSYR